MTITGWEGNATVPEFRYMSAITQFLGCRLLPATSSLPERWLGLSQFKRRAGTTTRPNGLFPISISILVATRIQRSIALA